MYEKDWKGGKLKAERAWNGCRHAGAGVEPKMKKGSRSSRDSRDSSFSCGRHYGPKYLSQYSTKSWGGESLHYKF